MTYIDISGLKKTYPGGGALSQQPAINDMNFKCEKGEFVIVVGPNGSGKSTLLRVLIGLLPFDAGTITVAGYRIPEEIQQIKPITGFVPQNVGLSPYLTPSETLSVFAGLYGIARKEIPHRVNKCLSLVGLEKQANLRSNTLSKGMLQRLCLARAVLHEPELLILDEPSDGLDPEVKNVFLNYILDQSRNSNVTVLFVTHHLDESSKIAHKVLLMDKGKEIFYNSPDFLRYTETSIKLNKPLENSVSKKINNWADSELEVSSETIKFTTSVENKRKILAYLQSEGVEIIKTESLQLSLEESYLKLIKKL